MKATIPTHGERDAESLRLVVWSLNGSANFTELSAFGLQLMAGASSLLQEGWAQAGSADAALIDPRDCDTAMVAVLIERFRDAGLAVVVLVDCPGVEREFLFLGADVVGTRDCSSSALALLIRSAVRSVCIRRELEQQVSTLQRKLEETKLIARAKAIVAERLKISEAEAFRNLRREARNRRRPLHDIAQLVVTAHEMMTAIGCQPAQSPLAQRVSRIKTALPKAANPKIPAAVDPFAHTVLGNNAIPS